LTFKLGAHGNSVVRYTGHRDTKLSAVYLSVDHAAGDRYDIYQFRMTWCDDGLMGDH